MRRLVVTLTAAALAGVSAPAAQADVGPADLEPHIRAFADIAAANGGNRAAGFPGYDRSADYVAARLQEAGWQVTRQPVGFPVFEERTPPVLGGYRARRDFVTVRGSGAGEVSGRVRLILSSRCTRRGFRAIRRGDVALLPFANCTFRRAALTAQREGAVGVLFDGGPDLYPLTGAMEGQLAVPVLSVRTGVLIRVLRSRRAIRMKVDGAVVQRTADNVLAELPAGNAVVMAGAHLDSVPEGPGINDNASGSALLLELAERLPAARRSATLRLAFWTGEEYGLYGSRQYVRGLPQPERRRIAGYLNFDMVASPRAVPEIYQGNRRIARALRATLRGARSVDLSGASDHAPFAAARIPVGGVYTGSLERARGGGVRDRCYHRRCDGAENVNLAVAARIATAAERAMAALAR